MKSAAVFLLSSFFFYIPLTNLRAQNRTDTAVKKTVSPYRMSRLPKQINTSDTTPRTQPPAPNSANRDDVNNEPKPSPVYIIPDTVRPVPVETETFVVSVLRLQKIYLNEDAVELIRLLNPEIANSKTVMSDYKLVLPEFPEPDSKIKKSVNQQFKKDLDPDVSANNEFTASAMTLDTLAAVFIATKFSVSDVSIQKSYSLLKSLLPAFANLNQQGAKKTKHTSRKTVNTLNVETAALNKVLSKCTASSQLSPDDINQVYSLIADMNILLYGITDKKLQLPGEWDNSFNKGAVKYTQAAYHEASDGDDQDETTLSDDDPRRFNIYVFRRSLVANAIKDPEMNTYRISYAIPALASDPIQWEKIPDPASTVHCYFAPARFTFTITDMRSHETYSATEDLYDAQKDPKEKWTILDLFDRHPTYKLVFLLQ